MLQSNAVALNIALEPNRIEPIAFNFPLLNQPNRIKTANHNRVGIKHPPEGRDKTFYLGVSLRLSFVFSEKRVRKLKKKANIKYVTFDARLFCTEESSVRKGLPYGRLFRTEVSSVRKRLPYGRLFRTEDSSVRKILPCGRLFRTEESSVRSVIFLGRAIQRTSFS